MKFLLILCLIFPIKTFSQSTSLKDLEEKRNELNHKILVLQDSLQLIEEKINGFPIQDLSEPIFAYALKGAVLRKKPNNSGEELQVFTRETKIQVIDIISEYYLVCISGECGYLYKKEVRESSGPSEEFFPENLSSDVEQPEHF